ncbi:hypothetical protein SAMN05877831_11235 [Rhodobacter maris]|uniref:DUF192 domain-containing protein n=1 Tax=Rhodobacter maris TaxID=446682 RepID=A0A285T1M5_9RHOB|nr:hypothetical protein SAMN05877831_11235 [Rhodobacter maris]
MAARASGDRAALCVLDRDGAELAGIAVEIADDEAERARGLMGRTMLAPGTGMLFFYESPREVAFWMQDTLIPLDMIFLDEEGRIARIHAGARPLDETPIPSGGPVRYVLELGGGQAAKLGLVPGFAVAPLVP